MKSSVHRFFKRIAATLLAICMTAGMSFVQPAMTAYASSELNDENIPDGASEATAFKWIGPTKGAGSEGDGINTKRFDIKGLDTGQTDYGNASIQTTYGYYGYATWIMTPISETTTEIPRAGDNSYLNRFKSLKPSPEHNGAVVASPDLGIEYKMTVTPSADKRYIFVDYYLYDTTGTGGTEGRTFYMGTGADSMINGDDQAYCYKNEERGFHMVNRSTKQTFDCITNDPDLGITKPDALYVGHYHPYWHYIFTGNNAVRSNGEDSGIAWSWKIKLHPYERVHKRVAFLIKATSYYVSEQHGGDDSSHEGTYQSPYKTIDYAISKLNGKKGYIYVMDYPDISASINVGGSAQQDITISSTDYDHDGHPVRDIKSLKRAAGFTGSIFKLTGAGKLKFADIKLDGSAVESAEPIVSAESGTLEINSGAVIANAKGSAAGNGGAVNVTGSASLSMNYGTVNGNVSKGKGAVYFNSSGKFEIINKNQVTGNTDGSKPANVYLATGKFITVNGDLDTSVIGVTAETSPTISLGTVTEAAQEVVIAKPGATYETQIPSGACPFADNFKADKESTGITVNQGTAGFGGVKNTVLRRSGYTVKFEYRDADTGGSVTGAPATPEGKYGVGDAVTVNAPGAIAGYTLTRVVIDQGTASTLVAGTDHKVTGTMPANDVVITYEFTKKRGSIKFEANGGTPEPAELMGDVGATVNALMPQVSRYGYTFGGWSTVNSKTAPNYITQLPSTFPENPVIYYAIFTPDNTVKFDYTVDYTNADGSIVFQTNSNPKAYSVEAQIQSGKKPVHGYIFSKPDSVLNPAVFNFGDGLGSVPFGEFHNTTGNFSGKMPGQDAAVKFAYKVDRNNMAARSTFTVKHKTASGVQVSPDQTYQVFPEDPLNAQPVSIYGYNYLSGSVTAGADADPTNLLSGLGNPQFAADGTFTGKMPNQNVEITYIYESTGEGYEFKANYIDNITTDARLKNITAPYTNNLPAAAAAEHEFKEFYGYLWADNSAVPATAGNFDATHKFTGIMPTDRLTLTYEYNRDASKWKDITYKAGANGRLNRGTDTSSDVRDIAGGYQTSILINDATTEGAAGSYTWSTILQKNLAPEAVADRYYRLGGWFIDTNADGIKDAGEEMITDDTRFTGAVTVSAYFEKDPAQWIDINFAAGEHGSINAGEALTLNIPYDKTWTDVALPAFTPEVNYLTEGWFDAVGNAMEGASALTRDMTYTVRFYPDPAVFGTDVRDPNASAAIDTNGKGKVTVFGTTRGYQYIITDLDGNIVDVVSGDISGRSYFENLNPGTRYKVYEATGRANAQPGQPISSVTGPISGPTEVLVPVVDTNYDIQYDEKDEGKTVLVVKPADPDSDYAVLDKHGNVVVTPETGADGWQTPTGSNPASATFSGLDYNEEYVVVARPKGSTGITAESKFPDGSTITTDPGGELEIPKFTVKAINGKVDSVAGADVDAESFEEAHKGEEVVLHAEVVDTNGHNFLYWKKTVGSVPGLADTIRDQDVTFTMPASNVVMTAYYDSHTAGNAVVTDEVRGGNKNEMALDPNKIADLEDELTTDDDRELININHADVTYKVVYNKNSVKENEATAVKASAFYNDDHEGAFHGAWGLNVDIERYVNGRKVGVASPSNATFDTYVQLDKEDVDMMDYQLYSVAEDPMDGHLIVQTVPMSEDPEITGGLFKFTAQAGMRYVLVYSRAYRVYFINDKAPTKYRYSFKVRRGESPNDSFYSFEYGHVETPIGSFVDSEGVEYNYEGWSYSDTKLKEFDPDREIKKKTNVYAYYKDNAAEVGDARQALKDELDAAIKDLDDYFLKLAERQEIIDSGFIQRAQDVFNQTGPRATIAELKAAINQLKSDMAPYKAILNRRYNHYGEIQNGSNRGGTAGGEGWGSGSGSGSSGGSGGSGRGGSGGGGRGGSGGGSRGAGAAGAGSGGPVKVPAPFIAQISKSYSVGNNGKWELVDASTDKWAFVLNGGIRLTSIWAKLDYANDDVNKNGWYHFNSRGLMDYGWFRDENMDWYYCNTVKDGWLGKMKTGWHYDESDKHWYYLDEATGKMATGWREIGGKWYFFTPQNTGETYAYDAKEEKWSFMQNQHRPLGSMYSNETTPDGYQVGADGAYRK